MTWLYVVWKVVFTFKNHRNEKKYILPDTACRVRSMRTEIFDHCVNLTLHEGDPRVINIDIISSLH